MPNISYKFTIPPNNYEAFRDDISAIASAINFEEIEFNDEARTVLFNCDACDLMRLFEKELQAQGKDKDYPFFCCSPNKFGDCVRFEDGKAIDFVTAYERETAIYEELRKSELKGGRAIAENKMAEKLSAGASLVIGEYHPDPQSKTKLMGLLQSLSHLEQKPVLVLERISSSRDQALQNWLKDGSPDSAIPQSVKKYCDFIDGQNLGGIWPSATEEERKVLKTAHLNILHCAKQNGFDVAFMESEHSTISISQANQSRHQHLISSMQHIKEENPGRNFIAFCGAYHDERSEETEVILSDVLDAFSCELFAKNLPDKLLETSQSYKNSGKDKTAEAYQQLAERYEKKLPPSNITRSNSAEKLNEQQQVGVTKRE